MSEIPGALVLRTKRDRQNLCVTFFLTSLSISLGMELPMLLARASVRLVRATELQSPSLSSRVQPRSWAGPIAFSVHSQHMEMFSGETSHRGCARLGGLGVQPQCFHWAALPCYLPTLRRARFRKKPIPSVQMVRLRLVLSPSLRVEMWRAQEGPLSRGCAVGQKASSWVEEKSAPQGSRPRAPSHPHHCAGSHISLLGDSGAGLANMNLVITQ